MKKLFIFLLLILIVAICSFGKNSNNIPNSFTPIKVQIFAADYSGENFIKNGNGVIVECDINKLQASLSLCSNVSGKTYVYNASLKDYENIKVGYKIQSIQELGNIKTFYGYSDFCGDCIFIEGKKVNTQVAFNTEENLLYVGNPILLGSY